MNENWQTRTGHKLVQTTAILALLIAIVDILYEPIFSRETTSIMAQVIGQDIVNLAISVPATLYLLYHTKKGSMKARTALIGIMAYYTYTFLSYVILFKLNEGFLLYTAAVATSLYGTLLLLAGINLGNLKITPSDSTKKYTPIVIGFILLVVVVLWTPDLAYFYTTGLHPERILADNVHTLAIHFQDLALVVPLSILTIWLLRKDEKMGYILAPILLVKAVSIGLAVLGMIVAMLYMGTPAVIGEIMIFIIATLVLGGYTAKYFNGIEMEMTR